MNLPPLDLVTTPLMESLVQDERFTLYRFLPDDDNIPVWDLKNIEKFVVNLYQIAELLYADLTVKDVSKYTHMSHCRVSLHCVGDDWHSPDFAYNDPYSNNRRFNEAPVIEWVNSILEKAGITKQFSIFQNNVVAADGKIYGCAANFLWTEQDILNTLRRILQHQPFLENLFRSSQTHYVNQWIHFTNFSFYQLVPYQIFPATLNLSKTVFDNHLPDFLTTLGLRLFYIGNEIERNSYRFLKEFSAIYLKGRVTSVQKVDQYFQIDCDNQSFKLIAQDDLETFIRQFNSFLKKIAFFLRLYLAEDLPLGSFAHVFLCDKDSGTALFQMLSTCTIAETFFTGSNLRYTLTLPYVENLHQVTIQRTYPESKLNSELNQKKELYIDFTAFPIQPLPAMPEITPTTSKKIYILREMGWSYNDGQASSYEGLADIYQSFDTYEAAWKRKKDLEIEAVKTNRCPHFYELSGRNPNWDTDFYAYVLAQLNLDIPKLSNQILLPETNRWEFRWHLHNFALKQFARDDKQIWDVLQLLQIDYYQIQEVEETTCFYKIYLPNYVINRLFAGTDFEGAYIRDQHDQAHVFDSYEAALQEFSQCLPYFRFQGTWSDLSDMPDILQSYVAQHRLLQYDTNTKILSFIENYWYHNEESNQTILGLIPLLRSITQCIRSFTVRNYEGARILRARTEIKRREANGDLPF